MNKTEKLQIQQDNCPYIGRTIVCLQYKVVKSWSKTYLFANHLTMRNYKHSNVDMGKMYIKIVASYFSFLVIPESSNHFPVGNQSLIWLADSKGFVASAWSWLEEIAWPCSTLCSTLSIATVSLETKPNKGPSYSCCQA